MKQGSHHNEATRAAIGNGVKRATDYREAAAAARALIYAGADVETTRLAIGQVLAIAPDDMRHVWEKYAAALAAGHRVKIASYPVTFLLPPTRELEAEVEVALGNILDPE